jgi:2-polyprenyl-3-methyl-5-hydroxy-6-metoxy-1,4-benzoquinol methylase
MITLSRVRAATAKRHCPVCEGAQPHKLVWKKWGYPILKCRGCGVGCTDAASFDPHSFYTADYFTGGHRDGYGDYTGSAAVLKAEFRGVLADLQRAAGSILPPLPPREGLGEGDDFTHGKHIQQGGSKNPPPAPPCKAREGSKNTLLEVGCAYGYFLDVANDAGYATRGVEICEDAVAACKSRGLNVDAGVLSESFLKNETYDAVAMLDVIEHLPNPAETFDLLGKAVKPGGHIVITTGNWNSLLSTVAGSRWRLMTPPQHLYFYTRSTLSKLLANHGFETVSLKAPWKRVPLGLMAYQLTRRLGVRLPLPGWLHRAGVPMNLFDAMRLVARRTA